MASTGGSWKNGSFKMKGKTRAKAKPAAKKAPVVASRSEIIAKAKKSGKDPLMELGKASNAKNLTPAKRMTEYKKNKEALGQKVTAKEMAALKKVMAKKTPTVYESAMSRKTGVSVAQLRREMKQAGF